MAEPRCHIQMTLKAITLDFWSHVGAGLRSERRPHCEEFGKPEKLNSTIISQTHLVSSAVEGSFAFIAVKCHLYQI